MSTDCFPQQCSCRTPLTAGCLTASTKLGAEPLKWSALRYGLRASEEGQMSRKRHKPEEIIIKLRQVDVLVSQGQSVAMRSAALA